MGRECLHQHSSAAVTLGAWWSDLQPNHLKWLILPGESPQHYTPLSRVCSTIIILSAHLRPYTLTEMETESVHMTSLHCTVPFIRLQQPSSVSHMLCPGNLNPNAYRNSFLKCLKQCLCICCGQLHWFKRSKCLVYPVLSNGHNMLCISWRGCVHLRFFCVCLCLLPANRKHRQFLKDLFHPLWSKWYYHSSDLHLGTVFLTVFKNIWTHQLQHTNLASLMEIVCTLWGRMQGKPG